MLDSVGKIFLFPPTAGFLRMLSVCPLPQRLEDVVVDVAKRLPGLDVSVEVTPTPNTGVNAIDHLVCPCTNKAFSINPDLLQQSVDTLFGWLNDQLSSKLTKSLPKEVKAFSDIDDLRLCFRKTKSSLG